MTYMRIIPRIDIKSDYLIKSIRYEGLRNLGKPEEFAKKYYEDGATELIIIDTVASLYRRESSFDTVKKISDAISIPLIFCGGLKNLEDVDRAFMSGADKVAFNTSLFQNENLISKVAEKYGKQSVVVSIEAKRIYYNQCECYINNGRDRTNIDTLEWAKKVEKLGAGEIFISSVDFDGTHLGYDIELAEKIISIVNIPVVVGSGAGSTKDIKELIDATTPSGISIGSALHYNNLTIDDILTKGLDNG